MTKRVGRPREGDTPRERFQCMVSSQTKSWLECKGRPPGRVIDELVEKAKLREDFDDE